MILQGTNDKTSTTPSFFVSLHPSILSSNCQCVLRTTIVHSIPLKTLTNTQIRPTNAAITALTNVLVRVVAATRTRRRVGGREMKERDDTGIVTPIVVASTTRCLNVGIFGITFFPFPAEIGVHFDDVRVDVFFGSGVVCDVDGFRGVVCGGGG